MSTALALLPSGAGWHTQVSWSDLDGVWRDFGDFGDLGFWLGTTTPSTPVDRHRDRHRDRSAEFLALLPPLRVALAEIEGG